MEVSLGYAVAAEKQADVEQALIWKPALLSLAVLKIFLLFLMSCCAAMMDLSVDFSLFFLLRVHWDFESVDGHISSLLENSQL